MHMSEGLTVWSTLFLLGAYHGINPGMGWLFAVARGIQEHRARCSVVARAYRPRPRALYRRGGSHRSTGPGGAANAAHPGRRGRDPGRTGRLQADPHPPLPLGRHASRFSRPHHLVISNGVRARRRPDGASGGAGGTSRASYGRSPRAISGVRATLIHTLGYFTVTAAAALLVYEKFGLAMLRRSWFNLDLIWATALVVTGLVRTD
jgi:hypothetical protein